MVAQKSWKFPSLCELSLKEKTSKIMNAFSSLSSSYRNILFSWFPKVSLRFVDSQHSFTVKLVKCRNSSFNNTLISKKNSLLISILSDSFNLHFFKTLTGPQRHFISSLNTFIFCNTRAWHKFLVLLLLNSLKTNITMSVFNAS